MGIGILTKIRGLERWKVSSYVKIWVNCEWPWNTVKEGFWDTFAKLECSDWLVKFITASEEVVVWFYLKPGLNLCVFIAWLTNYFYVCK